MTAAGGGKPAGSVSSDEHPDRRHRRRFSGLLMPTITIAVTALALYLLYRTLRGYNPDELVQSVTAVSPGRLIAAIGCAAASYLCLTIFDRLALRYVGHDLPYRKVALASFVSLSIGHNIGFAALSSGAIRYRFYSRAGLSGEEIAKLIAFCGATVFLGLVTLAAIGVLMRPGVAEDVLRIDRTAIFLIAAAALAIPVIYCVLALLLRRPVTIKGWSMEMPGIRLAVAQIVVGTLNFTFVAASLHQAIAAVADVPFAAVVTAYVLANLATIITHVPGGLGVIENVVIHLLPQSQLIGAVLVFRFAYFLLPLGFGLALFALSEAHLRVASRRPRIGSPAPN